MKKHLLLILCCIASLCGFAAEVTVTFSELEGISNGDAVTTEKPDDNLVISFAKGSNSNGNAPKYYTTGKAIRVYPGNTITFAGAEGATLNITKITFTTPSSNGSFDAQSSASAGNFDAPSKTWTGEANEVTLTMGGTKGHVRIEKVTIEYTVTEADTREECGLSWSAEELTADLADENVVFPTLANPNNLDVTYSSSNVEVATVDAEGKVTIVAEGTAKITAATEGNETYKPGNVTYTLTVTDNNKLGGANNPYTVAQALALDLKTNPTGVYIKGVVTEVTDCSVQYKNATYTIADDATSEETLLIFRGKGLNGNDITSEDEIEVGATVVVCGDVEDYNGTIELKNSQIVSYTEPAPDTREECGLSWSAEKAEAVIGKDITLPELTNPNKLDVTYSSSNAEVATVDAEGKVTLVAQGSTEITAAFKGNETYKPGSASYTLTVIEQKKPATPVVTVNGQEVADGATAEAELKATVTVTSEFATSIKANNETIELTDGAYTFETEESGEYTFVGVNEFGESEAVKVTIDIDDLSWKIAEGNEVTANFVFNEADTYLIDGVNIEEAEKETNNGTKYVELTADKKVTAGQIALSFTTESGTSPRIWPIKEGWELRIYKNADITISAPESISSIEVIFNDTKSFVDNPATDKKLIWTATGDAPVNSVTFKPDNATVKIASIKVVTGGLSYSVVSPEFYVNGTKMEDHGGDLSKVTEMKPGDKIELRSHERVALHWQTAEAPAEWQEQQEVASLMAVKPATDNWNIAEGNSVEYEIPANMEKNMIVQAKAVKNGLESKIAQVLVRANGNVTGIDAIEAADADAAAEYFNLQGVRVENPAAGLYIRRQGGKVEKVVVK